MNDWTIFASGPSGHDVPDNLEGHRVVCVNTAITFTPLHLVDTYFFHARCYHWMIPDLLTRGIKLVSFHDTPGMRLGRNPPAWLPQVEVLRTTRDIGWAVDRDDPQVVKWELGQYSPAKDPCGPSAVQYALNSGAGTIHLRGMEGGERGPDGAVAKSHAWAARYHRAILQACVDACPNVEFIHYGDPLFRLEGENVRMTECQPGA